MDSKLFELLKTIETLSPDELNKVNTWVTYNIEKKSKDFCCEKPSYNHNEIKRR